MTLSYFEINFDAILNGALGETEATAARKWLEAGKVVYPPPPGLQTTDAVGATDTRVIEEDHSAAAHKARRKSDEGGRQRKRIKSSVPPRPTEDYYGRAAFVSHNDIFGPTRRKPKPPSVPQAPENNNSDKQGAAPIPLPIVPRGWSIRATATHKNYIHEATGEKFRSYSTAKAKWESLGQSVPDDPALRVLPSGWSILTPKDQEDINGPSEEPYPELYISPEGLICNSLPAAHMVKGFTSTDISKKVSNIGAYIKSLARTAKKKSPDLRDREPAIMALIMQRLRAARFQHEQELMEVRKAGRVPVRKISEAAAKSAAAFQVRREKLREMGRRRRADRSR